MQTVSWGPPRTHRTQKPGLPLGGEDQQLMKQNRPPAGVLKSDPEAAAHHRGALRPLVFVHGDVLFWSLPLAPGCPLLVDLEDLVVQADLQNPGDPNQKGKGEKRGHK